MSATLDDVRFTRLRTFVVVWTAACVLAGVLVSWQTLQLQDGADAIDGAGRGLQSTATSLRELEGLPVVGNQVGKAADTVERGADTAQASSDQVRSTIVVLAILLGLSIAVLPTLPLVALTYLLRPE